MVWSWGAEHQETSPVPAVLPDPCTPPSPNQAVQLQGCFHETEIKTWRAAVLLQRNNIALCFEVLQHFVGLQGAECESAGQEGQAGCSSVPAASGEGRLFGRVSTLGAKEIWERCREHCSGTSYKLIVLSFPSTLQFFGFQSR